jgi:putative flavoprotein involved in K+ transport
VSRSVETVIVGAGQAGLALSRCLTDLGRDHLVLERGRVGERWRSERWDTFRLLTPAWHTRLPGHRYTGPDPDAFLDRDAVVGLFERYAASFAAPVLDGVTVVSVAPERGRWRVVTDAGAYLATNVVVATGPHDRPSVPAIASTLPAPVDQLHARDYRRPGQLRPGAVLVVGAGPTGQQLASELARAGRSVLLCVGRHQRLPRSYRGHDVFWWLDRLGVTEQTVDQQRRPQRAHPVLTAGRDLGLDVLVAQGVVPLGRLTAVDGRRVTLGDDLAVRYLEAEASARRFTANVDRFVAAHRLEVPQAPHRPASDSGATVPTWALDPPRTLDLRSAGVTTVLWATGYRRDYRWVRAPVLDGAGEPVHRRGITRAPGLAFLGLSWLYRRKSASIDGVGDDARYLASHLAARSHSGAIAA